MFFGDSITASWNDPQKSGGFFLGKPYVNRGISSQTTPQMLIRFEQDVIALKPQVVVILAGTNDIGGVTGPTPIVVAIEDNLTSMALDSPPGCSDGAPSASSCHPYSLRLMITASKMANQSCIVRTARLNTSRPSMSG